MKITIRVLPFLFVACAVFAQSPVTVTVNTRAPGEMIPTDFSGLSFETLSLRKNNEGVNGYLFDSTNTELLTLFRQLGVKNLRIGGSSVDSNPFDFVPGNDDIDALFRFAIAAGVKVIYSLRLANGDSVKDASIAKYIWDNYRKYLVCFTIGNEPNIYHGLDPEITDYTTYLAKWRRFASTILDSVPDAKFGGPDNDNGGTSWGTSFAHDELGSNIVTSIFFHYYVGGSAKSKTPQQIVDEVLSPEWVTTNYLTRYNASGAIVLPLGLPYRLTESNSYYVPKPGIWGGNNCFATALYALDYMHWWSEHNCSGVNFHTTQWKYNGTVYLDSIDNLQVYPMGYGIKAFDLGGHGDVDSVSISNPDGLNLTAYSVGGSDSLFVTIINKEHGTDARDAEATIVAPGLPANAGVMYLSAPNQDPEAISGVTLGGAAISDHGPWQGKWSCIDSVGAGRYAVKVPATSAAIVKIAGTITSVSDKLDVHHNLALAQNYPNPFNPMTTIGYELSATNHVALKVYDVLGRRVTTLVDGVENGGRYKVTFDGSRLASGVYFYRLRTSSGFEQIDKMILEK